ncbi:hypothetical protein F5883DRAFT_417875, partial [Diaporthe sp. PMI_573]
LLDIPKYIISNRLDMFYPVLDVLQSLLSPVILFYLCFCFFLLDPKWRNINLFWADKQETHC